MEPQPLKILLCVDDTTLASQLKQVFSGGSFSVVEVQTGLEVAMLAQRNPPDIIIVSASAPLLGGAELAQRLRLASRAREVPVFFVCSAPGDPQALAQAGVPIDRCLRAPFDPAQLAGHIHAILLRRCIDSIEGRSSQLDGNLSKVPPPHLLMTLEATAPSGVLRLRSGTLEGWLVFQDGHVLNAYLDDLEGEDALLTLLEWDSGTFAFFQMKVDLPVPPMGKPSGLILKYSQLLDDRSALGPHIPQANEVLTRAPSYTATDLDPVQEKMLGLVDGTRALDEILRAAGPLRWRALLALAGLVEKGLVLRRGGAPIAGGSEERLLIPEGAIERLHRALAAAGKDAAIGFGERPEASRGREQARIAVFLASTSHSLARSLRDLAGDRLDGPPDGPIGRGRWVLNLSPGIAIEFQEVSPGSYPVITESVRARLGAGLYLFSGLSIPDVGGARNFIRWARTWAPHLPVLLATYELEPERGLSLWEIQTHVEKEERVYLLPFPSFGRGEMGLLLSSAIARIAEDVETGTSAAARG